MITKFALLTMVVVVLYNLIHLTEKTLTNREDYAADDVRILDHRSRM